jgi:hypothetical protein
LRPPTPHPLARRAFIAATLALGSLVGVAAISPFAILVVVKHTPIAAAIILGSTGLGWWLVQGLRLGEGPVAWRWLLAAGLGLGATSLLVLALGTLGLLHRPICIALLAAFVAAGLVPACRHLRAAKRRTRDTTPAERGTGIPWLWLGTIGFVMFSLLGATMPPGTLWPEEGNAYDVLEYHLGVPREYFEVGRIGYLPHNIYANFPSNVEMLYLLAMVLHADPITAAFTAQVLNALLGVLAVAAVWLAAREFGPASGVIAGLVAASCPFLTYLAGVAYVENGLLLFTALALAAVVRAAKEAPRNISRWIVAAGLLSGLACGCKYTAIPMVLLPLTASVFHLALVRRASRPWLPVAFVLAGLATLGPWLVKNAVATGNPVFPLIRNVFPERPGIWNEDCARRWDEGHSLALEDRPLTGRLARLWSEVLGSRLFGPALAAAIVLGAARVWLARQRRDVAASSASPGTLTGMAACWLMLILGLAAWVALTHLVGRFAVTVIPPAAVILGEAWRVLRRPLHKAVALAVLAMLLAFNTRTVYRLFSNEEFDLLRLDAFGQIDLMTRGDWPGQKHVPCLNGLLARGERILVVADARRFYLDKNVDYCVVFSRNPFAEAAERMSTPELMDWLRRWRYAYVYVDQSEMARLRKGRYGFWPALDAALFARLQAAGLKPIESFEVPDRRAPYATLFRVGPSHTEPQPASTQPAPRPLPAETPSSQVT